MIWALLLACAPVAVEQLDTLEVRTWTVDRTGSGGVLVLQTRAEQGLEFDLPVPEVEGLTFSPDGDPIRERLGDHTVITQRWRYTGKKGSYEVPSLTVEAGETTAESDPLWIDLGVEAPNAEQLGDIVEPGQLWAIPWTPILSAIGALLLLVGAFVFGVARFLRRPPKPEVVLPPDVVALDAWELVRIDEELSDEDKASELSNIFRTYTEAVFAFPATAWTTTEILQRLQGMTHLPDGNVPRAKRMLQATDLIKYAEEEADGEFLEHLDADLRAFIGSTRPRAWTPDIDAPEPTRESA